MLKSALTTIVLISLTPLTVLAAPCDSNFVSKGNLITGTTYKTFADLPNVSVANAYEGALADIAKEPSWKVIAQDKAQGSIQAVQADSYAKGKTIPLNVNITAVGSGSTINMSYVTPPATLSPESAIKTQFCETIAAAGSAVNQVSIDAPASQVEAVKQEQASKVVEKNSQITGNSSQYIKNGLPCVAEVCIGDGLNELKKIKWQKVKITNDMSTEHRTFLSTIYKGDITASAPYIRNVGDINYFDNKALLHLEKVTANCPILNSLILNGNYITSSGNSTFVSITLLPTSDNLQQIWTVTEIKRRYPKAITIEQRNNVDNENKNRYFAYNQLKTKINDGVYIYFPKVDYGNGLLRLGYEGGGDINNRQKLHPLCGGSTKVNVD